MTKFENIKYESGFIGEVQGIKEKEYSITAKGTEKRIDITMWTVKEIENWVDTQAKRGNIVKGLVVESKNHVYAVL